MNAPLLVATDGSRGSAGAIRMARALSERDGTPVVVLAALQPVPLTTAGSAYPLLAGESRLEAVQFDLLRGAVEAQLRSICGEECDWPIEIEVGSPPAAIVRRAAELKASLVVMGLGRHSAADRWLGTETALKVIQLSHVPILAAHREAEGLPQRAVVAVDFSEFSRDAARCAGQVLGPGTEVHLAHVARPAFAGTDPEDGREWQETYRAGARTRLDAMRDDLLPRTQSRVFAALLEGETSRALLRYAGMTGAEMIACGSHGYGFFARMMAGSVSTGLVRGANCSVLVAPPRTLVDAVVQAEPRAAESLTTG